VNGSVLPLLSGDFPVFREAGGVPKKFRTDLSGIVKTRERYRKKYRKKRRYQ
jgi:hypothetical protein